MQVDKDGIRPVVAVIQARMSSTRLPGKVMKEVSGNTILGHVVSRLKASGLIDTVAVATTTERTDDLIAEWCAENKVPVYRGSLNDVLDRYFQAAKKFGAKTIVRVTSDCPLIDPALVDRVIERFSEGGYDHVSVGPTYPDGLDAEVFSFASLSKAHKEARLASEREHVTPYIWKNPGLFRLASIECGKDLSRMRWTVDDERDLLLVTKIYEGLGSEKLFHMEEVLLFLERNPELLEINSATARNEGYAKSLKEDKIIEKAV
ncbi:MAG: glycosyltransferase family protein [Deltaproteobacteria bacterium]|nr:glycosyltransferase family protein [Deltaproteobacteria bacterium]